MDPGGRFAHGAVTRGDRRGGVSVLVARQPVRRNFSNGRLLKIDVTGGPPQTVCTCNGRGATWSRDGVIVLNNGQGPLLRVSSAGGEPSPFTRLVAGQQAHAFPSFLPDGRHVLYYANASAPGIAGVYVASLDTGETKRLLDASSSGLYAASAGYLLFVRDNTLLAQSFDARSLTLSASRCRSPSTSNRPCSRA